MTDDTADTPTPDQPPKSSGAKLAFAFAGLLILGGIIYWGFTQDKPYGSTDEEPGADAPAVTASLPEPQTAPEPTSDVIVEPATVTPDTSEATTEIITKPAITLQESDTLLTGDVAALDIGIIGEQFVAEPHIIERGVAIIDNLRQGSLAYKVLPIDRPTKGFSYIDSGTAVTIDPEGFARYTGLAETIDALNTDAALALYQRYSGTLEDAWAMLGYRDTTASEVIIEALNMILLAPDTDLNAPLVKKEAVWVYEDEALEALPPLHKQLMRMGPENARLIKDKARELRSALLDSGVID